MKKVTLMAVAASALMVVSCGKKVSPEAQKAWDDFKAASEKFASEEAMGQAFAEATMDDFSAAVQEWKAVAEKMGAFKEQYTKEIADSLNTIAENCGANIQKATEAYQAAAEAAAAEAAELAEDAEAEVEE